MDFIIVVISNNERLDLDRDMHSPGAVDSSYQIVLTVVISV